MAYYGYQYETSPRKYEPEIEHKKKIVKKNQPVSKKDNYVKTKQKVQKKRKLKIEIKVLINAFFIFGIIFAVMACQALVEQKFKEKENLLAEYNELYVKLNSTQEASEDLRSVALGYGMQVKSATMLNLEKTDYTELHESVNSNETFWDKVIKSLKK